MGGTQDLNVDICKIPVYCAFETFKSASNHSIECSSVSAIVKKQWLSLEFARLMPIPVISTHAVEGNCNIDMSFKPYNKKQQ